MTSESTPLLAGEETEPPSAGGGNAATFYFLTQNDKKSSLESGSVRDTDGGEYVDLYPEGSTKEEFQPRAIDSVSSSPQNRQRQRKQQNHQNDQQKKHGGIFQRIFGRKQPAIVVPGTAAQSSAKNGVGVGNKAFGTLVKPRKAPVKVEPKVFFANERTFLAWLHTSIILAGASIAIVAFADENPWSQLYGVVLLPVAIAFITYAMFKYAQRANMIRRKDPGPYDDTVGPTVLGIMLMLSIVAQFAIKLYSIM